MWHMPPAKAQISLGILPVLSIYVVLVTRALVPNKANVFYSLFYRFFSQQVRVGGRNKNKNKIHSDHFPIKLKSKETRFRVIFDFNSIGKWSE